MYIHTTSRVLLSGMSGIEIIIEHPGKLRRMIYAFEVIHQIPQIAMFGWANVGPTDAHWLGQRWHQPLAQRCFGQLPLRWPNGGVSPLGQRPANVGPTESSTTLGQRLTNVVMLFLFVVCFSCIYLLLYRCPCVPVVLLYLAIHFECRFNCGLPRCKRCISADKSELCYQGRKRVYSMTK